jgi:hypothetical protein
MQEVAVRAAQDAGADSGASLNLGWSGVVGAFLKGAGKRPNGLFLPFFY